MTIRVKVFDESKGSFFDHFQHMPNHEEAMERAADFYPQPRYKDMVGYIGGILFLQAAYFEIFGYWPEVVLPNDNDDGRVWDAQFWLLFDSSVEYAKWKLTHG